MVNPHLKTRTIVRCCWPLWGCIAATTGAAIATGYLAVGADWLMAAVYATLTVWIGRDIPLFTRYAFGRLCSHIKTTSVDRFIAGE